MYIGNAHIFIIDMDRLIGFMEGKKKQTRSKKEERNEKEKNCACLP